MTTTITKDLCKVVDAELLAAARIIAAKHGLAVGKKGGGTFSSSSFATKIEFLVEGELSTSKKDEDAFRLYAEILGLKVEMLGKTFAMRGEHYKIVGALPSRSKNSVKILRVGDSSARICSPEFVLAGKFID